VYEEKECVKSQTYQGAVTQYE